MTYIGEKIEIPQVQTNEKSSKAVLTLGTSIAFGICGISLLLVIIYIAVKKYNTYKNH